MAANKDNFQANDFSYDIDIELDKSTLHFKEEDMEELEA